MGYARSHSCFTTASIQARLWPRAVPLLEAWKAHLQSLPGFQQADFSAQRTDTGDVRCHIVVTFEFAEQMAGWLDSPWATEQVIGALDPAPHDVASHTMENLA